MKLHEGLPTSPRTPCAVVILDALTGQKLPQEQWGPFRRIPLDWFVLVLKHKGFRVTPVWDRREEKRGTTVGRWLDENRFLPGITHLLFIPTHLILTQDGKTLCAWTDGCLHEGARQPRSPLLVVFRIERK